MYFTENRFISVSYYMKTSFDVLVYGGYHLFPWSICGKNP